MARAAMRRSDHPNAATGARGAGRLRSALPVALIAVLALLAGACTTDEPVTQAETDAPQARQAPKQAEAGTDRDGAGIAAAGTGTEGVADLVEDVTPSVVTVAIVPTETPGVVPGPGQEDAPEPGEQPAGSGIVYGDDLVVTNAHVVAPAEEVAVIFADGSSGDAEVVAADRITDVAVLRVDTGGEALPAAEFREQLPRVGEVAVAIGTPFGLENTVTAGIVSGLDRSIPGAAAAGIPALTGLLQTDAALSPGNSGGALVDADGRVVGMNVAYIPPQLQAVALGFAIPAATVVDVAEQLLEDGEVRHSFLGVRLAPLTPGVRQRLGVEAEDGALVFGVGEGSPADRAGIQVGDVVVEFGDVEVRDLGDLTAALRQRDPGDVVEVTVLREGQEQTLEVTLGDRPDSAAPADPGDPGPGPAPPPAEPPPAEPGRAPEPARDPGDVLPG